MEAPLQAATSAAACCEHLGQAEHGLAAAWSECSPHGSKGLQPGYGHTQAVDRIKYVRALRLGHPAESCAARCTAYDMWTHTAGICQSRRPLGWAKALEGLG